MNLASADCWYLTGATASGKTQVGLELAKLLNAEIISLDSMSVYRGMDVGTAKASPEEQAQVPHHLIDIVDPNQDFSLSQYVELAQTKIAEIQSRGREAIFVGGTPLYLKALIRGITEGPPPDWEFRRQVEQEVEHVGLEALHKRLQQIDPLSGAKLHPHDKRRIIRALEVYHLTGTPISHGQTQFDESRTAESCKVFVLDWPRSQLYERINARVEQMFSSGLVDEVEGLLQCYRSLSRTASQALGYQEVIKLLQSDGPKEKANLQETIKNVKTRTRRFGKRQMTWFRSLCECRFVSQGEDSAPVELAHQIVRLAEENQR